MHRPGPGLRAPASSAAPAPPLPPLSSRLPLRTPGWSRGPFSAPGAAAGPARQPSALPSPAAAPGAALLAGSAPLPPGQGPPPWSTPRPAPAPGPGPGPGPFPPGCRGAATSAGPGVVRGARPSRPRCPSGVTPFPSSSDAFIWPGTKGVCGGVGEAAGFQQSPGTAVTYVIFGCEKQGCAAPSLLLLIPRRRKLSQGAEAIRQSSPKEGLCSRVAG